MSSKPQHPRSSQWHVVAHEHLAREPHCRICKRKDKVQVHHLKPFHLHPELELDPDNLVTLCEGEGTDDHHLWFGHLGSWHSINEHCLDWCEAVQRRRAA